eukprot:CAMPEP_0180141218 /NCGR_PEP_ID=MMETSP0986-20121125/14747_1 /TAXON_ID=697907 /ORGANISM="non described non described, Strain CCMP2293" /LENGTH=59 /DNA_ID=CAMNT_0022083969 /DNA_START=126 /DNA_END=305 /DNA_ORIENTATION=+
MKPESGFNGSNSPSNRNIEIQRFAQAVRAGGTLAEFGASSYRAVNKGAPPLVPRDSESL